MESRWLQPGETLLDSIAVRCEVFVDEQHIPADEEIDEFDLTAEHLVIYHEGRPVATGRVLQVDGEWRVGRVAVRKPYRGQGLGVRLMRELMERTYALGASEIHIHAQTPVRGFYEKLGYVAYGEPFDDGGIEHVGMMVTR